MNPRRAFLVVLLVLLLGLAAAWGVQEYQRRQRIEVARKAAPQMLRENTKDFPEARFVGVDGSVLTFAWMEEVQRGGTKFVELVPHEGTLLNPGDGAVRATEPAIPFANLEKDRLLRIDMETDPVNPARYVINAVYIVD